MTTLLGATGAAIILIAFVALQSRKLNQSDLNYNLLNLLGSLILIAYDILLKSVPFFVLNTIWGTAALVEVLKIVKSHKQLNTKQLTKK